MNSKKTALIWILAALAGAAAGGAAMANERERTGARPAQEEATLGGGCFWCLEAIFEQLEGVRKVVSGFAGGGHGQVSYREVCEGGTGHAEVVRVVFDPRVVSYAELLTVFFATHDPTTLNRQGADVGPQYRSAIFWHDREQLAAAKRVIEALERDEVFEDPIVTEVSPLDAFIPAEGYHQDYYARNSDQAYCQVVINPKLDKFRKAFADRLKK